MPGTLRVQNINCIMIHNICIHTYIPPPPPHPHTTADYPIATPKEYTTPHDTIHQRHHIKDTVQMHILENATLTHLNTPPRQPRVNITTLTHSQGRPTQHRPSNATVYCMGIISEVAKHDTWLVCYSQACLGLFGREI